MSELTLLLLQVGFLILLWFFVFALVYSLRADLFGVKVRKLPEPTAAAPVASAAAASDLTAPVVARPPRAPEPAPRDSAQRSSAQQSGPQQATRDSVTRIVITSGPKAGLELPLTGEPLTIGRASESGLVIRDDYTSSHHARLLLWGENWMIQDMDSTNGTFLGGERVGAPVAITIGTPIKVGATTFELRA